MGKEQGGTTDREKCVHAMGGRVSAPSRVIFDESMFKQAKGRGKVPSEILPKGSKTAAKSLGLDEGGVDERGETE